MSGTELHHHQGPATVIRYAIHAHRGVVAKTAARFDFGTTQVLVTSSAVEAIEQGLPPAEHRPSISLNGPAPSWSPGLAAKRLEALLHGGSAVCLRITSLVPELALSYGWRNAQVGLAFPNGDAADRVLRDVIDLETQVLTALPLVLPEGASPRFKTFDRATLVRLPHEERPLSLVSVSGGLGFASVAYRADTLDEAAFGRLADPARFPIRNLDLIRNALDETVGAPEGFVAAWAALERMAKRSYEAYLPALLRADEGVLPGTMADVQRRLREPGAKGSLISQFLILRWGLSPEGLIDDEATFRELNEHRQQIYHYGDVAEIAHARDGAIGLLLKLLALTADRGPPSVEPASFRSQAPDPASDTT